VNLGVAKDQRLSLNPSQISGACGRLMCCLRYEHEFYVQSRKRFPKEGKIFVTKLGEEKVMTIDIFHERITLRGVEGDTRSLTLAEFKAETEQHAEGVAQPAGVEDEEIHPEEISPELMYTAEHPVFTPRVNVVAERPPAENGNAQSGEGPGKRRRGRRGGRRGRGGDDTPSGTQ
jgi:hypothetical protein